MTSTKLPWNQKKIMMIHKIELHKSNENQKIFNSYSKSFNSMFKSIRKHLNSQNQSKFDVSLIDVYLMTKLHQHLSIT